MSTSFIGNKNTIEQLATADNDQNGSIARILPETRPPLHLVVPEGQLQIHTAPYRGSFARVLSEAIRAAGLGRNVMIAQFLKGGVDQGPKGVIRLCGRLQWLRPAVTSCITKPSKANSVNKAESLTHEAVNEIWQICKDEILRGNLDQLVLDEVGLATALGYISQEELINILQKRPDAMDIILTGPSIPNLVSSMADQITELRCAN